MMLRMGQSIPFEVGAGIDVPLKVYVSCGAGCDLRGAAIEIRASAGVVGVSSVAHHQQRVNETEVFTITVPKQVGDHDWSIVFPRHEFQSGLHEEIVHPISFKTVPHRTSIAIWDVPSPVPMNSSFKVKAGVLCSVNCKLIGQVFEVLDEAGSRLCEGKLGEVPWIATSGLYWGEVELRAPATEGVLFWSVTFPGIGGELPHEAASASFSFRADKPPEHLVTVNVVAKDSGAAVGDVEVRLGLHVAWTDPQGGANIRLPGGSFELSIRKDGFEAQPVTVDVTGDLTLQVQASTAPTHAELEQRMAADLIQHYV
jgi:hypothetical protein